MAPKIKVPMDFGVHLRSSPTHNTLKLNTSEGGEVLASSVILSFNSPVIDHMTTTLHMTSVDMLEFSEAAVQVFVDAAYSGTAEGINREIFRDINKMTNVFEVAWLAEKCSEYFTEVTNLIVTPSYSDLLYLFEEACFVYENLNKKDYIELANDKIQELDWKQQFIDKYLENADRLSTKKLDMVIELAGSDINFVVQTLVNQLTEMFKIQEPCIPVSFKYLLDNSNLRSCRQVRRHLFNELFNLLRELPNSQIRWSFDLLFKSTEMASDDEKSAPNNHLLSTDALKNNTVLNLYHNLDFSMSFDELLEWISVSESVTKLIMAIEAVCSWNYYHHVNSSLNTVINEKNMQAKFRCLAKEKGWASLPPELAASHIRIYDTSKSYADFKLMPYCFSKATISSVVINCLNTCCDPFSVLATKNKLIFHFKHPSVTKCNKPGKCGFILKTVPSKAALWKLELCTQDKDYRDTDVHFHEEIKAKHMHLILSRTFINGSDSILFPLSWFGYVSSSSERDKLTKRFTACEHNRFQLLYQLH